MGKDGDQAPDLQLQETNGTCEQHQDPVALAPALIADPGSHSPSSLPPTSFLSPQTAIFSVLCVSHLPEQHGPSH